MSATTARTSSTCAVRSDSDVVKARQLGRNFAREIGFSLPDQALIATAISELARNIVSYAESGWIEICEVERGRRRGMRIIAADKGPGIPNLEDAMTDGFSTGRSLGLGLPGTRRLVDEFAITSEVGKGVTVTVAKWIS